MCNTCQHAIWTFWPPHKQTMDKSQKRKVSEEDRTFNTMWADKFFYKIKCKKMIYALSFSFLMSKGFCGSRCVFSVENGSNTLKSPESEFCDLSLSMHYNNLGQCGQADLLFRGCRCTIILKCARSEVTFKAAYSF